MSKQSKLESLLEALVNTAIGFSITMIMFPLVNILIGVQMNAGQMSLSTAIFTVVSIARGYVIRRFFNNNVYFTVKNKVITFFEKRKS